MFRAEIRNERARTVVVLTGDLDLATVAELRSVCVEAAAGSASDVVVDLTAADFVDSVGVGVLLGLRKRVVGAGGQLTIVCSEPRILQVLDLTGVSHVVPIVGRLDDPVASVE